MKKKIISFILATVTTLISMSLTNGIIVKAKSFNEIYQSTYDCVTKLKEMGKRYDITPRLKNNGSIMEDNNVADVTLSSRAIQKTIDQLRVYQHQFPNEYWKARNTFSEIGDSYQQPIYEWIVDIAINTPKLLETIDYKNRQTAPNLLRYLNERLEHANILNEGVDPAYKGAYQAAIDDAKQKLYDAKEKFKLANGWTKENNKLYYNKVKKTGWEFIINGVYYFNEDGSMKTGLHSVENKDTKNTFWYYLKPSSGERAEGWQKINNKWYFFNTEIGEMQTTGWVGVLYNRNGILSQTTCKKPYEHEYYNFKYYYYIDKPGSILKGKHTIDGITYTFDENGVLIK